MIIYIYIYSFSRATILVSENLHRYSSKGPFEGSVAKDVKKSRVHQFLRSKVTTEIYNGRAATSYLHRTQRIPKLFGPQRLGGNTNKYPWNGSIFVSDVNSNYDH